ncbi:MAG: TerB family tellurite resistance protein [Methanobacteriota archaeon]|nr:MAG: TerB family tellurite resistance protein [Euryarchaeota archaeon]
MTSKDRILLYLSDYTHVADRYELPSGLTQESIANGTGIQRKHLPQYLKDLIVTGLVVQRKAHVKGMKQRMNGYYLSALGFSKADEMRQSLSGVVVPVKFPNQVVEMPLNKIDEATSVHITFCDIVTAAVVNGSLDMESLEGIEVRRIADLTASDEATEAYRKALSTAWRDGKVTATERYLIDQLRETLKISEEEHRSLECEILRKLAEDHMEFRRIYRQVLEIALADGQIEGAEKEILNTLRRMLRVSGEEHEAMARELQTELFGPYRERNVGSTLE